MTSRTVSRSGTLAVVVVPEPLRRFDRHLEGPGETERSIDRKTDQKRDQPDHEFFANALNIVHGRTSVPPDIMSAMNLRAIGILPYCRVLIWDGAWSPSP